VRLELQADCYAGIWVHNASTTPDPDTGVPFLTEPSQEEISSAIQAAESVGDDHIQQRSGGGVDADSWTHGSSEQRVRWFTTGMESGSTQQCDTFEVPGSDL
jgi:putative metalloprotease